MRIGLCHDSAGTRHAGGVAVYVTQVAAALARSHEVTLYTQGGDLSTVLRDSDATVIELPTFRDHAIHALEPVSPLDAQNRCKLAMITWMHRNGFIDHVENHTDVLCTFQFLDDLLLSQLVDVPTVFQYHGLDSVGLGTRLRERFSRTEHVLANSRDTAEQIRARLGYHVDGVVTPGVDLDRFHPDVEPEISTDRPTILFVGRVVEAKGIFDLLEAVATLDREVDLRVVGAGDTDRVDRRSTELGIADAVAIEGEVPHVDLPGYYAAADVFCLPSHAESFGMANLEAMACGTPVVTTDLEAIDEYLIDGEHGHLLRRGKPIDIAEALERLLDDSDHRRTMGGRAAERAEAFSWEASADAFVRAFADALDDRADPTRPSAESMHTPPGRR